MSHELSESMHQPVLLTPGPMTTSAATKAAMLRDWGSWDIAFNALTASVCQDIVEIAGGTGTHVCVPLQGSGTFAVEAALGTLVPRHGKVLVPDNGAYCQRIERILRYLGRETVVLPHREDQPADPARIAAVLAADPQITHVAQVHCETGTGILNPLDEIGTIVRRAGRRMIVDAMSTFGALPLDVRVLPVDAVVAASGKCLEGVPGMGFIVADRETLAAAAGNSHSLAMDLHDQWIYMQMTGQWRFTPPTHVVAALRAALDQHREAGGRAERLRRYAENCAVLVGGLRALGLRTFLDDGVQAPIIVTFHAPRDPAWDFREFYRRVRERGFILYPGKLTQVETFRVGCIGAIDASTMHQAVAAIADSLADMGVQDFAPLAAEGVA